VLHPGQGKPPQEPPTWNLSFRFVQVEAVLVVHMLGETLEASGQDRIKSAPVVGQEQVRAFALQ
jgi:hypothetical protein